MCATQTTLNRLKQTKIFYSVPTQSFITIMLYSGVQLSTQFTQLKATGRHVTISSDRIGVLLSCIATLVSVLPPVQAEPGDQREANFGGS